MATKFIAHTREDGQEQSVANHLQGTADRAETFADAFGAGPLGRLAGLLHDIGKYSDAFQARIRNPAPTSKVDHSTAGAQQANALGLHPVAFAVAGHHAGLPDGGSHNDGGDDATFFGRMQKNVHPCAAWQEEISLPAADLPAFCTTDSFTLAFFTRMLYSCLVDADYLDTEAFMQGPQPRGAEEELHALLLKMRARADAWLNVPSAGFLNEKRNGVLRACLSAGQALPRGSYTLTVPTGGGKTFASLAFALEHAAQNGMARVIYVIPYTSIIDQTVEKFGEILGPENVLAHYAGADYQLREKGELSPADYRRALAAENWGVPIVVTTAVQFFESLFAVRSSQCRKLHNIANSVIVFDEAQTLPFPYLRPCAAAICQLVRHYGATAVLCTATQPALDDLFAEFLPGGAPLREICPGAADLYTALRRTTLRDLGEVPADDLSARLAGHGQVLCVVNRRSTAQKLFGELPEEGRYCLTTLLCAADRRAQLKEIRARLESGLPCRVVSTTLIEAGVDVDFPVAYRELAGLDSILQTAGRCNREGSHTAAESFVYLFALAGNPVPPTLMPSVNALHAAQRAYPDALDLPPAIACYFTTLRMVKGGKSQDQKEILRAFTEGCTGQALPFASIAREFNLIDTPTRTVYLPVGEGALLCRRLQEGERSRSLLRSLGLYSVAVYKTHFEALDRAGALTMPEEGVAVLTDLSLYDPHTGLAMDVDLGQAFMI